MFIFEIVGFGGFRRTAYSVHPKGCTLQCYYTNNLLNNNLSYNQKEVRITPFRLAAEDSNPARSAFVKNASFLIVKLEGRQPIFAFRTKNLQFFANGEFEEVFAINSKQNKEKAQVIRRCIAEHFDEVLRRICRKNRTWFESSTATYIYNMLVF